MQLEKVNDLNKRPLKYLLIAVFVLFFGLTRVPGLDRDSINPDAVNWHRRSEQFVNGLKFQQWNKTYQHYHPGVTLMWITGPTEEVLRQLSPKDRVYTASNYSTFHFVTKYVLVVAQLMLTMILLYALTQVLGFKIAFLSVSLFTFEPFFIGNSRLLHLDVLLTLFLMLGLTFSYLNLKKFSWLTGVVSGIFLGLAILTKSIAIGGILFVIIVGLGYFVYSREYKKALNYVLSIVIPFVLTVFILFPALWVDAPYYITEIFSESERVGVRKGHGQIFWGQETRDPGVLFYFFVLLMKLSPFLVLGVLLNLAGRVEIPLKRVNLVSKTKEKIANIIERFRAFTSSLQKKDKLFSFILYIAVFYLGYVTVMIFPTKKIDRYMVPLFPFLSIVAVFGYYNVKRIFKKKFYVGVLVLFGIISIAFPFFSIYPYLFTYASPVFGNSTNAHYVIAQKPFGIGMHELKEHILKEYGMVNVGMIDVKPLTTIYGGSKVFDIREEGTDNFDVIVLGPNEVMPEKVLESDYTFVYDSSVFINDLDYWKVYVKAE